MKTEKSLIPEFETIEENLFARKSYSVIHINNHFLVPCLKPNIVDLTVIPGFSLDEGEEEEEELDDNLKELNSFPILSSQLSLLTNQEPKGEKQLQHFPKNQQKKEQFKLIYRQP